jgi:hypothetical protein
MVTAGQLIAVGMVLLQIYTPNYTRRDQRFYSAVKSNFVYALQTQIFMYLGNGQWLARFGQFFQQPDPARCRAIPGFMQYVLWIKLCFHE